MTKHLFHSVGHSPVFKIWLHAKVKRSIMATTPALTNSAAMLSVWSDFSIFIALTAASTFSCRIERGFLPGFCWQLSAVGFPLVPLL